MLMKLISILNFLLYFRHSIFGKNTVVGGELVRGLVGI